MKHTPGPWRVYNHKLREQFGTKIIQIEDAHGNAVVAWSGFDACTMPVARKLANARLIAAAPELLEALKELRTLMEEVRTGNYSPDTFTNQIADKVIAKAEGREP